MIITLDGPSGSGKSTLASLLASKLGFFYMNSGYVYRSLAYILVTKFGYDHQKLQNPKIDDVAVVLDKNNFEYRYDRGIAQVFFKGQEITHYLKNSDVSHNASIIAAHEQVRQHVVALQRYFGAQYNLVTDGRDGGTEIFPQAACKFYITAAPEIRARRLQVDLEKKGVQINFEQALDMTISRDERDMQRAIAPLKKADDAIEIDTSHQSIDQVLDFLIAIIQK